jgi:hypothetical protein
LGGRGKRIPVQGQPGQKHKALYESKMTGRGGEYSCQPQPQPAKISIHVQMCE